MKLGRIYVEKKCEWKSESELSVRVSVISVISVSVGLINVGVIISVRYVHSRIREGHCVNQWMGRWMDGRYSLANLFWGRGGERDGRGWEGVEG